MRDWISRNAFPIIMVLLAAAVVIGTFELLDALVGSTPPGGSGEESGGAVEEAPGVAGLLKVAVLLAVGAAVTAVVRAKVADRTPGIPPGPSRT